MSTISISIPWHRPLPRTRLDRLEPLCFIDEPDEHGTGCKITTCVTRSKKGSADFATVTDIKTIWSLLKIGISHSSYFAQAVSRQSPEYLHLY
jgi:hypothetical protein